MASGSLSFVGDFCSGLKCIGVVGEKIENEQMFIFSLQYNFQCAILVSRVVNDLSIGNESYDLFPMLLYQFIQTEVDK